MCADLVLFHLCLTPEILQSFVSLVSRHVNQGVQCVHLILQIAGVLNVTKLYLTYTIHTVTSATEADLCFMGAYMYFREYLLKF